MSLRMFISLMPKYGINSSLIPSTPAMSQGCDQPEKVCSPSVCRFQRLKVSGRGISETSR